MSTANSIRISLAILLFGVLVFALVGNPAVAQDSQPNVIVIYADDLGSFDANCYGSKDLETPHIDDLAKKGVRFTQMYSPSAICSASRAGLMTGRIPARAGVPGNVSSMKGVAGMPTTESTLAEVMKSNGYVTGHVGKWHLGYTPETMPNGQGFDQSFGHMGGCIDNYSHFFYWNGPNRHDLWQNGKEIFRDGEYFGTLMVDECKDFLNQNRKKPFFLYWAINWPHYPLQGTQKWREKYKDLPHPRNKYAAFVSSMDEMIGEVVDHLDSLGLRDETIILFQSDHGHSVEVRTHGGGGNPGELRGCKACLFEGGIRVPSIISMPGTIPQNQTRNQLVAGTDWLPTIAKLTGAKLPSSKLDGKDISAVIQSASAKSPHEYLYWQLGQGPNAQWAVRKGNWKLLGNPKDIRDPKSIKKSDKLFLVNLGKDASEKANVVKSNPEMAAELKKIRERYVGELK